MHGNVTGSNDQSIAADIAVLAFAVIGATLILMRIIWQRLSIVCEHAVKSGQGKSIFELRGTLIMVAFIGIGLWTIGSQYKDVEWYSLWPFFIVIYGLISGTLIVLVIEIWHWKKTRSISGLLEVISGYTLVGAWILLLSSFGLSLFAIMGVSGVALGLELSIGYNISKWMLYNGISCFGVGIVIFAMWWFFNEITTN